ncbi:MAG TPA: ribosome maturation factor RimP [bacterium]|nr:ribosome maturation factor RimP [bacterium]
MWGVREKALVDQLEPVARSLGLTIVELELPHNTGGILRIFVDALEDRKVTVDDCAALSPVASSFLDTQEGFDFRYYLEVSSPGLDRPVRRWADLPRFAGKRMQVAFSEKIDGRKKVIGILVSVDDAADSFTIQADDGAAVTVRRGMVKRINLIWEGDK